MGEPTGSTVVRIFAAPPTVVFDDWATPASFAIWRAGGEIEIPPDSVSMDVRPGGNWAATMVLGNEMPGFHWRGEFVEVQRPHRLLLTMTDEPGDSTRAADRVPFHCRQRPRRGLPLPGRVLVGGPPQVRRGMSLPPR